MEQQQVTYRWTSILEASRHLWTKLEDLAAAVEAAGWICMTVQPSWTLEIWWFLLLLQGVSPPAAPPAAPLHQAAASHPKPSFQPSLPPPPPAPPSFQGDSSATSRVSTQRVSGWRWRRCFFPTAAARFHPGFLTAGFQATGSGCRGCREVSLSLSLSSLLHTHSSFSCTFCLRVDVSLFHPPVTPSFSPSSSSSSLRQPAKSVGAPLLSLSHSGSSLALFSLSRIAPAHL